MSAGRRGSEATVKAFRLDRAALAFKPRRMSGIRRWPADLQRAEEAYRRTIRGRGSPAQSESGGDGAERRTDRRAERCRNGPSSRAHHRASQDVTVPARVKAPRVSDAHGRVKLSRSSLRTSSVDHARTEAARDVSRARLRGREAYYEGCAR
jgi:hypothetical protein